MSPCRSPEPVSRQLHVFSARIVHETRADLTGSGVPVHHSTNHREDQGFIDQGNMFQVYVYIGRRKRPIFQHVCNLNSTSDPFPIEKLFDVNTENGANNPITALKCT